MIGQTVLSLFVVWLHLGFAPTRATEKPPNKVQRLHFGAVKMIALILPLQRSEDRARRRRKETSPERSDRRARELGIGGKLFGIRN